MKQTRSIMGMHITIEIIDSQVTIKDIEAIFNYFVSIDTVFSPYKKTSEVSQINDGRVKPQDMSNEMKHILYLAEKTKKETQGFFDIYQNGRLDPSGIVKGWAIWQASLMLEKKGFKNFYVDAGGDVQVKGKNAEGQPWVIGIQNPFNLTEIVKVIALENKGIATSGTAIRGQHIYNPHQPNILISEVVSLTVIGPNVYEADRFATAAFAMEQKGIYFIKSLPGFEGYMIDSKGIATYTKGFDTFVIPNKLSVSTIQI